MGRLLLCCAVSILAYAGLFAFVLDRPLTLGALQARVESTLALADTIHEPKLVILAGSNAPYSHRCEVIAPIAGRPCINAGVAVGIGLDYLFARWEPKLLPGDIVYLPLEEAQYARSRTAAELGPDASIMLRHDRATLLRMGWHRQVAAVFAGDLRAAVMSVLETALALKGFHDPRAQASGGFNAQGDHVGHTLALGAGNRQELAEMVPFHPSADAIAAGYGAAEVGQFLDWARSHGVRAIGGLPTGFADSPIGQSETAAIEAVFRAHGAAFLELPGHSRYPRGDFFDSADHLNEPAQIRHSVAVGRALAAINARAAEMQATARQPAPLP